MQAGPIPPQAGCGAASHPLDNPVWHALQGPQRHLGRTDGLAARFEPDVTPFAAMRHPTDAAALASLVGLAGDGRPVVLTGPPVELPSGWDDLGHIPGVQMVGENAVGAVDPEAVTLGPDDVPDMLELVAATRPGPFLARTIACGTYLGLRDSDGRLRAMAGERLRPPGYTEVSAVCTAIDSRGQGLATRLVRSVVALITARGDTPFLHAAADNTSAIRIYERLGFRLRTEVDFRVIRPRRPQEPDPPPVLGQI